MTTRKCLYPLILALSFIPYANASSNKDIYGTWCFYEQSYEGNTTPEKVIITWNNDGTYKWTEGFFHQTGTWKISDDTLEMTNVGTHKIINIGTTSMELRRISLMKLKKGNCN